MVLNYKILAAVYSLRQSKIAFWSKNNIPESAIDNGDGSPGIVVFVRLSKDSTKKCFLMHLAETVEWQSL